MLPVSGPDEASLARTETLSGSSASCGSKATSGGSWSRRRWTGSEAESAYEVLPAWSSSQTWIVWSPWAPAAIEGRAWTSAPSTAPSTHPSGPQSRSAPGRPGQTAAVGCPTRARTSSVRRHPSPPTSSGRTLVGGSLSTHTGYDPSVMFPAASVARTATRAAPDATVSVESRGATAVLVRGYVTLVRAAAVRGERRDGWPPPGAQTTNGEPYRAGEIPPMVASATSPQCEIRLSPRSGGKTLGASACRFQEPDGQVRSRPAGGPTALAVDEPAVGRARGLHDGLGERRVAVDRCARPRDSRPRARVR